MTTDVKVKNRIAMANVIGGGILALAAFSSLPILENAAPTDSSDIVLHVGEYLDRVPLTKLALIGGAVWTAISLWGRIPRKVKIDEADVRGWRVFLGIGKYGRRYYHDFNEIAHLKVGGVTGSGKSKGLEVILAQIIRTKKPADAEIHIIDMKGGASFAHFSRCPHVAGRIYSDVRDARAALYAVYETMQLRLAEIKNARASFRPIPYFPRIFVIIDEGGELSPAYAFDKRDKEVRAECLAILSSLSRVGREPHVDVVYSTQRPSAETLPPGIRGQIDATMAYRTQNELDSNILLRNENAAAIRNIKGRMLYQHPDGEYELQTAIVPDEIVQEWIEDSFGGPIIDIPHREAQGKDEETYRSDTTVRLSERTVPRDWG